MVKPNTINLNSVRLNTVALNHYGNISGGGSKPDPIAAWIRKHMAFRYDTKGYTNEVLSQTKQLEDLSGNNRPMLLNNFLFDMMSGIDGYKNGVFTKDSNNILWDKINDRTIKGKPSTNELDFRYYRIIDYTNGIMHIKWHVEGIVDGNKVYVCQYSVPGIKGELHNGDNDITIDINESSMPNYSYVSIISDQPYDTDITITQIPEYPGALVTDGVDDYGVVQNMAHGVKMLFMTVNPTQTKRYLYDQRKDNLQPHTFAIVNHIGIIAYNSRNTDGYTYIDGTLNTKLITDNLIDKKQIITILNNNVSESNTEQPKFFASLSKIENMSCAFYNAIGFDSIPTEEDGFTEQELIDYVIKKYELNKI